MPDTSSPGANPTTPGPTSVTTQEKQLPRTVRLGLTRRTLGGHPWALGLIESRRTPGAALLSHHEAVLACLRRGGFSVALASHAFSVLDAYVYGFVLTELNLPFEAGETPAEFVDEIRTALSPERYPHLVEMITDQVIGREYTYGQEFEFGLAIILDGLERHLATADA